MRRYLSPLHRCDDVVTQNPTLATEVCADRIAALTSKIPFFHRPVAVLGGGPRELRLFSAISWVHPPRLTPCLVAGKR